MDGFEDAAEVVVAEEVVVLVGAVVDAEADLPFTKWTVSPSAIL